MENLELEREEALSICHSFILDGGFRQGKAYREAKEIINQAKSVGEIFRALSNARKSW